MKLFAEPIYLVYFLAALAGWWCLLWLGNKRKQHAVNALFTIVKGMCAPSIEVYR